MVAPQQVYASAVNRSASGSHHPDLVWPASINERIPSYAIVNQAFDEALPDRPSTPTQIPVPEIPETPTPNSRIAQVEGTPYSPILGGHNGDDSGSSYLDSA
ncbi:hypothetical protein V502_06157 [Pseudogymnoascus sp. VKM F-4520 (FW-2644)]|nr:hypothetical protein V502_06157 [Pseudogymnoascus sp. VKM F-4520 (FW-2644)]